MKLSLGMAFSSAFLILLLPSPFAVAAAERDPGGALGALLEYARANNPELAVLRHEADAARERVEQAASLPDPKFQIELMDFTNTMSGGGASLLPGQVGQTRYRGIQPLPFWGKRYLRGEAAQARAGRSGAMTEVAAVEIEARIKKSFAAYYEAAKRIDILAETLDLVGALERLAETRYGVGLVPQQDLIQAQTEMTSLKVELVEAERRRRDSAARLNAALPRPSDAPLSTPDALPIPPEGFDLASLFSLARERSPELVRDRFGIAAARSNRELVYLNRYPDFAVGLTHNRPRDGTASWDLMVELNIPLQQSARRAQEREAEQLVNATHARNEATEARLNGRLGETLAAFQSSRDKTRLLKYTLLPQANATLEAAQAGYESGRVNFNTLIEAERRILRARLSLLDAEVDVSIRHAELEQLVGASL